MVWTEVHLRRPGTYTALQYTLTESTDPKRTTMTANGGSMHADLDLFIHADSPLVHD